MPFSADLLALEDETILMLHGELDVWAQEGFVTALGAVGDDVARLVLDLSDLNYVDVASVGIIHQCRALLEQRGGTLVLRSPNDLVRRILEVTGVLSNGARDPVQHRIVVPLPPRAYQSVPVERRWS